MRTTATYLTALCVLALAGCADQPVNRQDVASQPIGPSFTFERYTYPAYYQFVLAKNEGGKLELCAASVVVEASDKPEPTPYQGLAEFAGGTKISLDFIKRYYAMESSDLGQALMRVNAAPLSDWLKTEISKLPANCVVTQVTWRDDFQEPRLTGDDSSLLIKHSAPQNGFILPIPKAS